MFCIILCFIFIILLHVQNKHFNQSIKTIERFNSVENKLLKVSEKPSEADRHIGKQCEKLNLWLLL